MPTTTLRDVNGLDNTPARLDAATLVMIDFQNTYTRGVMELEGWQPALEAAADLLAKARSAGARVVHVVHDGGVGSPYDIQAEIGAIHALVQPIPGEPIVVKQAPNAFHGTNLDELLSDAGQTDVVIAGFMTHMCVQFTSEGAFLAGLRPTVVANACATRELKRGERVIPAHMIHDAALAGIADLYGMVVSSAAEIS